MCCVPLLVLLLLRTAHSTQAAQTKLRVSDPKTAQRLTASGGRVLVDYGGFQLIEVDDAAVAAAQAEGAESAEESHFIQLNARPLDTRKPEVKQLRKTAAAFQGRQLQLVQFVGPIKPEWRDELEQLGAQVVHYLPENTYLVCADSPTLARFQSWAGTAGVVQWEGSYTGDLKLHPRARPTGAQGNPIKLETDTFAVQLLADAAANPATLALIAQRQLAPIERQFTALHYLNVVVRLPADRLAELAAQPDVISIQPHFPRHQMDERQAQILAANLSGTEPSGPGYLAWLASKGFTQAQFAESGFVVDMTDSGIDNGTLAPGHFGLYESGDPALTSRVAYHRLEGSPNNGSTLEGCDGHGNLNAHIIAGYNDRADGFPHTDAAGFHFGLGVCPFVKVGASVIFDADDFTRPNFNHLQSRAYRDGARVSNNSWGTDDDGAYDVDAQNYDALLRDAQPAGAAVATEGNQEMVIVFAAGNKGPETQSVGSPGTAKNVIVVGAAENVHSHSTANGGNDALGDDGCNMPDSQANSANDIAHFSGRGPCADGRQKPDLAAPGSHITGGVAQSSLTTTGTGAALACFKATGVCGLPRSGTAGSANNFFPLGQQFYSTSSGTSHAAPAVAGACALVRQYFLNAGRNAPSPAMTKAFLVNAARYLDGVNAGDTLPSPTQGMGEVNLGVAFDGEPRVLHDQLGVDKFTATGQTRAVEGNVADPSKPFRVTLAWTDAPGSTTGNAYNNDLNLTVTVGGNTYKGNVFNGGVSIPDGSADGKNNVESVFLPAGVAGDFSVTVMAANINSDGVPNEAPATDQDFALVIYNGAETGGPAVTTESLALVTESCAPGNGAVDAGETVTLNFALRNLGTVNTTNLVAALLSSGGVNEPSGAQAYGVLVAGGDSMTQAFSFTAAGTCGSNIVATLALTDGGASLGALTFTIPLGRFGPISAQNFDGRAVLPDGWTTTASGRQSEWTNSITRSDTAPSAAFSPAPGAIGVNELVSPVISISSAAAQLTFRHDYHTENGWDGGVLEIRIGAGDFTDLVAAGGSFLTGGYNQTLYETPNASNNPLAGRLAWSGNSEGFITTTATLPAAAAGQNVQFRWRCGTDGDVSGTGWYVDTVVVSVLCCCGGDAVTLPLLTADQAVLTAEGCLAPNGAVDPDETVTLELGLKNIGTASSTNLVATLLATGGVTSPGLPQSYGVVTAGGATVLRPFSFTANGACGSPLTVTLQLQDGTRELGLVAYDLMLGVKSEVVCENFDGVAAPTLPAGWTTTASGAQTAWSTDSAIRDASPNAAASTAAGANGVNELTSPVLALPLGDAKLMFRNHHNLEASATMGFDGGVLEIKIGAGAWTDIVTAGGSFVSGGYNFFLGSGYGNPLAGRRAWSGNSDGFITTIVNLPVAAAGRSVQFRWRCGTDGSIGGPGWRVDSIALVTRGCCADFSPPIITTPPSNHTAFVNETVLLAVAASGTAPLSFQWQLAGTNLPAATNSTLTRLKVQLADAGDYSVVVSNVAGTATSGSALLTVLPLAAQGIIARWDFNSALADANPATGLLTPVIGAGSASLVGGATATFATGSVWDLNPTDNSGWNTTSYPAPDSGNKTCGVQFNVSTVGRQHLAISWEQRVSVAASKYGRLQYSTNGTTFVDFPSAHEMSASSAFESKTNRLAALAGVNHNPNFAFRFVSEFESTAAQTTNAHYVTVAGVPYGPDGTMRYDLVTVWGQVTQDTIPGVALTALEYLTNGQFQFTCDGATGSSWIVQASPDLSNWVSLFTNLAPFVFLATNDVGQSQGFYRVKLAP